MSTRKKTVTMEEAISSKKAAFKKLNRLLQEV